VLKFCNTESFLSAAVKLPDDTCEDEIAEMKNKNSKINRIFVFIA
jgi:hypothetical protein